MCRRNCIFRYYLGNLGVWCDVLFGQYELPFEELFRWSWCVVCLMCDMNCSLKNYLVFFLVRVVLDLRYELQFEELFSFFLVCGVLDVRYDLQFQ